jgi:hypothetical protein
MRNTTAQSSILPRLARLVMLPASLLAGVVLVGGAGDAVAQNATERYDVTFESVTSNCAKDRELALSKGRVAIDQGQQVKLRFEGLTGAAASLPEMVGSQRRGGKIKADATATDAQGRRQRLTVSGRVDGKGSIQLLFIAELADDKGNSQCSQTWNVTGKQAR